MPLHITGAFDWRRQGGAGRRDTAAESSKGANVFPAGREAFGDRRRGAGAVNGRLPTVTSRGQDKSMQTTATTLQGGSLPVRFFSVLQQWPTSEGRRSSSLPRAFFYLLALVRGGHPALLGHLPRWKTELLRH